MHPHVLAVMAQQHGLVTRPQALRAGLDERSIDRAVREGRWVAVRRGVYVDRERWEGLEPHTGRMLLRDRAASLRMRLPHVLSHDSAARLLGMQVLRAAVPLTHVTRPGVLGTRTEHGVKHHKAPYLPTQVVEVAGARSLDLARTACDLAREHPLEHGVAAMDAALRGGATEEDLWLAAGAMWCWPGVTRVRSAIELSDAGSDSLGETLSRLLLIELGIGQPHTQLGPARGPP